MRQMVLLLTILLSTTPLLANVEINYEIQQDSFEEREAYALQIYQSELEQIANEKRLAEIEEEINGNS